MALHEEQHEMSAVYDNISNPGSCNNIPKSHSGEDSKASSAASGKKKTGFSNNFDASLVHGTFTAQKCSNSL